MLHLQIILKGNIAHLPSLRPSDLPASLTDHLATGPIMVCISCRDDDQGAIVGVSRAGVHIEEGQTREIISQNYVIERAMGPGETYERPLQTRFGAATLRLRHEVSHE